MNKIRIAHPKHDHILAMYKATLKENVDLGILNNRLKSGEEFKVALFRYNDDGILRFRYCVPALEKDLPEIFENLKESQLYLLSIANKVTPIPIEAEIENV